MEERLCYTVRSPTIIWQKAQVTQVTALPTPADGSETAWT